MGDGHGLYDGRHIAHWLHMVKREKMKKKHGELKFNLICLAGVALFILAYCLVTGIVDPANIVYYFD